MRVKAAGADLFGPAAGAAGVFAVPDGEWLYHDGFLTKDAADRLYAKLLADAPWKIERIRMFGRWVEEPRRTAWFADADVFYRYSGRLLRPRAWTPELTAVRRRVEEACGTAFNSVLLNRYDGGEHGMGWHADNEPELGVNPVIASLTLGAERRFCLKHRRIRGERHTLTLAHGSLLLMRGALQHHWLHALPKTRRPAKTRINLTFRKILPA